MNRLFRRPLSRALLRTLLLGLCAVLASSCVWYPYGYGRGYCGLIAGARFEPIEKAGHFPHLEQPEQFASRVLAFADAAAPAAPRARRA